MRLPTLRAALAAAAATSALLMTAACGNDGASSDSPVIVTGSGQSSANDAEAYTDGTYEAKGSYANPGGESSIDVTLTLKGGVVSDMALKPGAVGTSLQYQKQFIGGAADQVVGKSLNDVKVAKVSGSSLTSQGFNLALSEIKADAAA